MSKLREIGDFLDTLSDGIVGRFEAPVPDGEPQNNIWYRIMIPEGKTADGSEYHIYIKKASSNNLCIFLSGGGVAWNEYMADRPISGGAVISGLPNYYWNNLRPLTRIMNINNGITEIGNPFNPFDDWNFIIITYATGDFHVGGNDFKYISESGEEKIIHFNGLKNFEAGMSRGKEFFDNPEKLLIAGDSAGAFAVPALTPRILENYYPDCLDITLLSDSAQLLYSDWKKTAKDIWGAPNDIYSALSSENITLDWYKRLYAEYGGRLTYLYASSTRDYLLSAYYNDVINHKYKSEPLIQDEFHKKMREMLGQLKDITSRFGLFIYRWPALQMPSGTVHTCVRHKRFYLKNLSGISMADWLMNAVNGTVYDVGMDFIEK